ATMRRTSCRKPSPWYFSRRARSPPCTAGAALEPSRAGVRSCRGRIACPPRRSHRDTRPRCPSRAARGHTAEVRLTMSKLFDTSRIPDDPAHWDALAERVAAHAARESTRRNGFEWLAQSRVGWIAASLLLAAAPGWMALPVDASDATTARGDWLRALAPSDDVAK